MRKKTFLFHYFQGEGDTGQSEDASAVSQGGRGKITLLKKQLEEKDRKIAEKEETIKVNIIVKCQSSVLGPLQWLTSIKIGTDHLSFNPKKCTRHLPEVQVN